MKNLKDIILPISVLAGMIIGVGFFSLPYVALKTGLGLVLVYFLILGIIVTKLHLIFGELSLNTPDFKRIPGFAEFYLGRWGKRVSLFFSIFWGIGGIVAYLIVGGSFLKSLLFPFFSWTDKTYNLIYFFVGALFIYFGIKAISRLSLWALGFLFIVFVAMFLKGSHLISLDHFFLGSVSSLKDLVLPYGPILYSLWGVSLVPMVEEMLKGKKHLIWKTITIASILPIIIYLCFIYLVLGLTGVNTSQTALIGLEQHIGPEIVNLALVLGLLTTFTSFVSSGLVLKNVFIYDLKFSKDASWFITCITPLLLFFFGMNNFIEVINLLGSFGLGVNGILILLMYKKLKEKKGERSPFWIYPLILFFSLGIIYELFNLIN